MLMMVPLMIWSARMLIDSQACRSEINTPAAMAAITPPIRAGVTPKKELGVVGKLPWMASATMNAIYAPKSIIPSIPMFTTPLRSLNTPHNAPSAIGVARPRIMGPMCPVVITLNR